MSARIREGFVDGPKGRLYYRLDGGRGPWLVCLNGIGVCMSFWEPFARQMGRSCRVARFDFRAHGRSDGPPEPTDISIATCVDDTEAIVAALGIEDPILCGHSMGGQVGFEYYRRHRDGVAALVPTLCTSGHAIATFFDTRLSLAAFEVFKKVVQVAPNGLSQALRPLLLSGVAERAVRMLGIIHPTLAPHELMVPYLEQLSRTDFRSYAALAQSLQDHDAADLLPSIDVPTLVVAGEKDLFTPLRLAHDLVRRIPGAELLIIPGGTHAALMEQPDLLCLRVEQFLEERVLARLAATADAG
ncbi:MAG TPA: alpha/beta fold hydrolase [Myxococcales bacterium]